MRKTSLRRVACGERWRSPQVDERLAAAPQHACLAACPNSSTCRRARRASTPCLGKTWPQYRVATTRTDRILPYGYFSLVSNGGTRCKFHILS